MNLKPFFQKGFSLQIQRPGLPPAGPLTPCLQAMSQVDTSGRPFSPAGADLARLFSQRKTRALFMHTAGSGITPWRGLIILDGDYRGRGQVKSPDTIGLVAHELTHLLQRELKPNYFWPNGRLHPSRWRRWLGDSTNFMEVLAYLVGWSVEHDLLATQAASPIIPPEKRTYFLNILRTLRNRLATLAFPDARNAARLVIKTFPGNQVYRANYRLESRLPDGRIPPGSWHAWLRQMGFSTQTIDHILLLAAQGKVEPVDPHPVA